MSVAEKKIKEILALGSVGSPHHSPEVPPEVLARQATLLAGGQAGYRISKYGTEGLKLLYQYLGDVTKVPAIKDYAYQIGLGTTALITLLAEFFVVNPTARIFVFGSAFFIITDFLDYIEEIIKKAIAGSPSS